MKIILGPTPCLLQLLLLAQLFLYSVSRPALNSSLCHNLESMTHQVDKVNSHCKALHGLNDNELSVIQVLEYRLHSLPTVEYTASDIGSLTINRSLSEMYVGFRAFKVHVDWLETVRHNTGLSIQSAQTVKGHLQQLSTLLPASLRQIGVEVTPTMTPPSFPAVSTAFEALWFSVELSEKLKMFCLWSKRVLQQHQSSRCPE